MKILSMTATFGKLNNQTLSLKPDLNIIEAPNEWGKSTWCAFVMAMLYGIDTGSRTKTGFLADKKHYAPWSGQPMSGSMEILWDDRRITIERQSNSKTPMGTVKAFETETGIPVPELAVPAPGQVLLGVERSVFEQSGFIRLADMPVKPDDALRRRLNALVTTGDESGASDALFQKLKDLKNACKHNKTGKIPEAEAQLGAIQNRLDSIANLQKQIADLARLEAEQEAQLRLLKNHKQALSYAAQLQYAQKLAAAQAELSSAEQAWKQAEDTCKGLPSQAQLRQSLDRLQQHRETRDALHTKAQLLPPLPQPPVGLEPFRGKDPQTAVDDAARDFQTMSELANKQKSSLLLILGIAVFLAGVGLSFAYLIAGIIVAAAGAVAAILLGFVKKQKVKSEIAAICDRYRGIPADRWELEAKAYADAQKAYNDTVQARQQELAEINRQLEENNAAIAQITGGESVSRFEEQCREALQKHDRLQEYARRYQQTQEVLQALSGAGKPVEPPAFADTLDLTLEETEHRLAETEKQQRQLRQQLDYLRGTKSAQGEEEALRAQAHQIQRRIAGLKQYYNALTRAQEALAEAVQVLQRRFAPRIAQRAKELFARMTHGRYDKLLLNSDLSVETGAIDETTQWGALWRSDGTVDQLYLSLRLAVARELTPNAPLVLDDALVRFDDVRLAAALDILREEAGEKQVILFTCQSREKQLNGEETQ